MIKGTPTCADEIPHSGDLPDALPEKRKKADSRASPMAGDSRTIRQERKETNAMKQERGKRYGKGSGKQLWK